MRRIFFLKKIEEITHSYSDCVLNVPNEFSKYVLCNIIKKREREWERERESEKVGKWKIEKVKKWDSEKVREW